MLSSNKVEIDSEARKGCRETSHLGGTGGQFSPLRGKPFTGHAGALTIAVRTHLSPKTRQSSLFWGHACGLSRKWQSSGASCRRRRLPLIRATPQVSTRRVACAKGNDWPAAQYMPSASSGLVMMTSSTLRIIFTTCVARRSCEHLPCSVSYTSCSFMSIVPRSRQSTPQ